MAKMHRRYIRLNGRLKKSPLFSNATDADRWYNEKLREKQHIHEGVPLPTDDRTTLKLYFHSIWLPARKKKYSKATWGSDEQRFRDYIEPVIGNLKVSKINTIQVRGCLIQITDKHDLSIQTRNRCRSLLSKIFGDAMLEEKPLRTTNPARGITFNDPRKGKKKPTHIHRQKDIEAYLKGAKKVSNAYKNYPKPWLAKKTFAMTCTFLMSALRKQELIAITWGCFDAEEKMLIVKAKFIQAENEISQGTKAGEDESREVPIPDVLIRILEDYKKTCDLQADDDFMFTNEDGDHLQAHEPNDALGWVKEASGVNAYPHALRHSFGRWFVANGGNLKSLQTIMGHSNYATTEIYSDLVAEQVRKESNRVSFDIDDED